MRVFHSKHQKLILQCYPAGKAPDKKPNSSELSYLLYYALTRRIKLEKVSVFLDRKTASDSHHNRTGNVLVSLSIVAALIERCADNLNVFAPYVCSILLLALKIQDIAVAREVVLTYGTFCTHLDLALFSGDKDFVGKFSDLSQELVNIGENKQGPNKLEWKLLSLTSCRYVFSCLGYSKLSKKFIRSCMPILVDFVREHVTEEELKSRVSSQIKVENDAHVSRVILNRLSTYKNGSEQSILEETLVEEAFSALRTLFNTSSLSQIVEATFELVKHCYTVRAPNSWGTSFLALCTTWIPVQLRFTALSLLQKLDSLDLDFELQKHYASYVLALVSLDVNMIGLSISDIMQQLLTLQSKLFLTQAEKFESDEVRQLSSLYSQCICNLSTHIYYFDQVPDSVQEILFKIDTVFLLAPLSPSQSKQVYDLVMTLLGDIANILTTLRKKSSIITRNQVTLEHWEISLPLLAPPLEDASNSELPKNLLSKIQIRYLEVFQDFLKHELVLGDDKKTQVSNLSSESIQDINEFTKPDFNDYITELENFICQFFIYLDRYLLREVDAKVLSVLIDVLVDLLLTLGINFVANFVPYYFHWQLALNQSSIEHQDKVKDTVAHIVMYYSLRSLDAMYPTELQGYVSKSSFYANFLVDIEYRKLNGLWVEQLLAHPTNFEVMKNLNPKSHQDRNGVLRFNTSRKAIQDFVNGNGFTATWINVNRLLRLEIQKHSHNELPSNIPVFSEASSFSESGSSSSYRRAGLGLGNANDITSIHSELVHNYQNNGRNHYDYSNGSVLTSEQPRFFNSPRVADLKELIFEHKGGNKILNDFVFNSTSSIASAKIKPNAGSILSKLMMTANVNDIVKDFDSDDEIVV